MKGGFKLHEMQEKKRAQEDEFAIERKPCVICDKVLAGPYGRWLLADDTEVWSCSKTHEEAYADTRRA